MPLRSYAHVSIGCSTSNDCIPHDRVLAVLIARDLLVDTHVGTVNKADVSSPSLPIHRPTLHCETIESMYTVLAFWCLEAP